MRTAPQVVLVRSSGRNQISLIRPIFVDSWCRWPTGTLFHAEPHRRVRFLQKLAARRLDKFFLASLFS